MTTWKEYMKQQTEYASQFPQFIGNMIHEEDQVSVSIPQYTRPQVRGEDVTILGPKPKDFTGLGYRNGDILVQYPDGEEGCVRASDIREGASGERQIGAE